MRRNFPCKYKAYLKRDGAVCGLVMDKKLTEKEKRNERKEEMKLIKEKERRKIP